MEHRRIPSSACPACKTVHHFSGGVDLTDAPKFVLPLGPGAVFVCRGCARVLQIQRNLTLNEIADPNFLADPAIVEERWNAVDVYGITDIPEDLALTALDGDQQVVARLEPDPLVKSMVVWPNDPPIQLGDVTVDFGYVVSITTEPEDLEMIVAGAHPEAAEMVFRVLNAAWPEIDKLPWYGQRFEFEHGQGYQYVLAPIPDHDALHLPQSSRYVQVLCQDIHGLWPWDDRGEPMPVFAGPDWRPTDADPVVLPHPQHIEGLIDVDDAPRAPIDIHEVR